MAQIMKSSYKSKKVDLDFPTSISLGFRQRGVALLAVLWLSVALSLMALSTASIVRTETVSVNNKLDSQRGYYMARGGIEAAIYAIGNPLSLRVGETRTPAPDEYVPGRRWMHFDYQGGSTLVEIIPENAKIGANQASLAQLQALFEQLGLQSDESAELAGAMVEWRSPLTSTIETPFDIFYSTVSPPYHAKHAVFEDLEELLAVKGMTRDLYFGELSQKSDGAWQRRPSIPDLLTTEPNLGGINVNYAAAEVMATMPGWDNQLADQIVSARSDGVIGARPFDSLDDLTRRVPAVATVTAISPIYLNSGSVFTLIATAQPDGTKVRRTVRAIVRIESSLPLGHRIQGWWEDWPWSPVPANAFEGNEDGI